MERRRHRVVELLADKLRDPPHPDFRLLLVLPAGAFFEIASDRIARVSNHYNLPDWTRQVTG